MTYVLVINPYSPSTLVQSTVLSSTTPVQRLHSARVYGPVAQLQTAWNTYYLWSCPVPFIVYIPVHKYFYMFLCVSFSLVAIPVYVKHSISFKENSSCGRFDVTIGPKQNMGKTIEGITVTVHMPKVVLNMNLTPTQGSYTFDPVTKVQPLQVKSEQVFCNLFVVGVEDVAEEKQCPYLASS